MSGDPFTDELDTATAAGEEAVRVTANVSGSHHCHVCHDDGWVGLDLTVKDQAITYTEHAAPCMYCEVGVAVTKCVQTGIDYRFGSGKPREQPWRGDPGVLTDVDPLLLHSTRCFICSPHAVTFDEYLGTDQGMADPHAGALQAALAARSQRRLARSAGPQPLGKGLTPARAPRAGDGRVAGPSRAPAAPPVRPPAGSASFRGRFAAAAGDTVGEHPTERSET